ncbi:MAG: Smr/MutS family protein [Deltaproteobacteria bacterium]|nr:Smr/MutS family protein [Deltaproteobacteria bacterium]MBI3076855.1 Smr/MutS family protein [Deltaproteobacteria bacterium]
MAEQRKRPPDPKPEDAEDEEPLPDLVTVPLEDSIDLHSFNPRDIPAVVEEYLDRCFRAGFREVRLIHGRGMGAQRQVVHKLLKRLPYVEGFTEAPAERGGWGATVVTLAVPAPETSPEQP